MAYTLLSRMTIANPQVAMAIAKIVRKRTLGVERTVAAFVGMMRLCLRLDAVAARGIGIPRYGNLSVQLDSLGAYPPMTGQLDHMRKRLERCRQAVARAEREAVRTADRRARESYVLLAEGWAGLADDIEFRLNGHREGAES